MDIIKDTRAPNAPDTGPALRPAPINSAATSNAPPGQAEPSPRSASSSVNQTNIAQPISRPLPQQSTVASLKPQSSPAPTPAFAAAGLAPLPPAAPPPSRTPIPTDGQTKATPIMPSAPRKPVPRKRVGLLALFSVVSVLALAGVIAVVWVLINNKNDATNSQFATVQIPLNDLVSADGLSLLGTRSLTVNGALIANQAFIISPSTQPSNGTRGQIYFDQTTNKLNYFNGSSFVELVGGGSGLVTTIGGQSGAVTLGQGLTGASGQIANSGVLSVQGQTGSVTFTAGNGIALAGTNISNTGVLSVAAGAGSVTVVNDGNGNITIGGGGGGSGTVQSPGGTAGKIAKFTGVQTIADSLLSEVGATVVVTGNLDVTGALSLGSPLTVGNGGTGTNTLALNGVVLGNGVNALSAVTAGGAGLCFMSTAGAPAFSACPAAAGVASLNGLTGTLSLANATAAGSTITINDASTSQKGIASFNSTNFSASSGAINTVQDINTTAAPTFGRLTLSSSQASNPMLLVNNTNASASGNLLDLQTNSVTQMSISPAGAMTLVGTLNGQTISSTANFTGTLGVSGLASLNGGASVTGTLTANTITPNAAMTVGATGQSLLLQGNALTSLTATDGASKTTLSFVTPTANVTYRLQTATAGTYDICTTVGNCAGTGGGVTTTGGTLNKLAKFTGAQTIADSIITDDGSTVTIGGTLSVNTLTPSGALTVGATSQSFLLQGNASSTVTATNAGNTTTVSFATPTANVVYRFATATAGTYDICTTVGNCAGSGGGVTTTGGTNGRIAKFTGAQTIADSLLSEAGSTITVNGTLSANTITPTADMTVGATTQSFLLQGSATSTVTATDGASTTTLAFVTPTANVTYRLQTAAAGTYDICTSVNNCSSANASLSNLSSVAINASLTPGTAGAIDLGGSALPFRDLYIAGSSGTPASNNFKITGTATGARTITLPNASGTVCIDTNNCSYVSLQAGSPGTAQTGNINVGGTIIAGTAMQAPLLTTADATSGSTAALTMRTGDLTGGSSTSTGDITIRSGNASGTATNSGNITIDAGTATGTKGTLSVGTANASAVGVGNVAAALSLYGSTASTMTFQNGVNTTTLTFQAPTANVAYRFPTAVAGSYDICTTVGNCAGTGGGVTTPGGTAGKIAKFTGSQTIADSLLSETGSTVTVDGNLNLVTGNQFQINGAQISSANLSNDANLAKLNITQTFTGSSNVFKNASDSVDAFSVQNAASQHLFTADTSGSQILLGTASSLAGKLAFYNATNSNTITIIPAVATGARTITLPDETGTVCLQTSTNCGFAVSSGGTGYIQNQSASNQTADFRISGTGRANTALQAPLLDTATAVALNIGTTNATGINLNQTTTLAVDKYLAMSNAAFNGDIIVSQVTGDTNSRFIVKANGGLNWGPGNAVTDTNLYRDGVATLHTDGSVIAGGTVTVQGANSLALGLTGTNTGAILFKGATAASGTLTLIGPSNPSTNTITLPNETGTVCTTGSVCSGYAPASGSANYIQNQTAAQQTASYWISGTARADTSLQAPTLDTATAVALNIGTTNATAINLNQDTTVTAGKQLVVTSALTTLTGATTGDALAVSNSTSTGRIAVFKDNAAEVFVIGNGGSTSLTTTTDSTTAFTVQGTAVDSVLSADTYNNTVKLRSLFASNASTYDAIWLQGNKNAVTAFIGGNDNVDAYTANQSSGSLRFNGANLAWGDFGYYPTGGGSGNYGQFRMSTTGSAINTTPNAKLGVGDLYVASAIGIANTSPTEALDVTGNINVGSANSYKIGGVIAMEASGSYLRINQSNQFANGIYTGTSGVRVGGVTGVLVGSAGGDGQIALIPDGLDNVRRITLNGGTGSIQGFTATLTGATSGDALTVSNSTSTGNVAVFKDDATAVATIANGGGTTFQNSTNSTAAFRVLNSAGSSLFSIDSTNGGLASLLGMNSGETGSWNSAATTLTGARAYAGTAIANGYVYVVGGNSTTTPQSTVYYAKVNSDGTTGAWTTSTYALPAATSYTSAVAQNGYLYVLGGSNSGGTEQATVYFARLNSDGSTGSWYTTTVLPAARSNGSAFSVNGYMYYIGGQSTTDTAQNTTYYSKINSDGTLGSWTAGSTITNARKSAQVVTANGYVYVAGGVGNTGNYQTSVYYATLNAGTGAIGTFATTSALPGTRAEGSALVANGYMYVIGGRDTTTYQTSVYYSKLSGADGTAGTWATATNVLPATRGGRSAFVSNGYLITIGGYDGSDTTAAVYSASVARVQIGASLDLVSLQSADATTSGSATQGSTGGSITAGNGTFVGNMQVQGMTNLSQGLNVNGITTLEGNTYVAGTLSLSSTIAAYEGFENVTFPPSGGTGTWTTGGNTNWARSTTHYNEGAASAASGTIADSQSSWLDVDYTWSQAGSMTFEWDVSSEGGWDYLVVCVDKDSTCARDTDYAYRISGLGGGWQQINIPMTAGAHSIRWLYGKDSSTAEGDDKGWVDNVRFNGGEGKITGNGINFSPAAGYNITIGDNDSTAALLVLDRYNGSSDPVGTNGGMYYSTYMSKFRCYEANGWHDCAGGNLGYSEVTSAQGGITSAVDLAGYSVDITVPSSHRVRISAELSYTSTVAGDAPGIDFYEDGASVYVCNIHLVKANEGDIIKCDVILQPTAGAHTYKLRGYRAGGSGTISTNVSSGAPGYIMVEDIGQ